MSVMRRQQSVSKQLSTQLHGQARENGGWPAVRKMHASGSDRGSELAATIHVDHEPASRRASVVQQPSYAQFQISRDRRFSTRRVLGTLTTNIVARSPSALSRILVDGGDKLSGTRGAMLLSKYGLMAKRSWVGRILRSFMGLDGSGQKIVEVPLDPEALEELLRLASEKDRRDQESLAEALHRARAQRASTFKPAGASPTAQCAGDPLAAGDAPHGPGASDGHCGSDVGPAQAEPASPLDALEESERLLTEAAALCQTRARPARARRGRVPLLLEDASPPPSGAVAALRELVRLFAFGVPDEARGRLAEHVEEGVFLAARGGAGLRRNNACIDLAALACHAERQRGRAGAQLA